MDVALLALAGVSLGWALSWVTAWYERKATRRDDLKVRKSHVLADLTMLLDTYDLSSGTVRGLDTETEQQRYFAGWKIKLEAIVREMRSIAFLDTKTELATVKVAEAINTFVVVLDLSTSEERTQTIIDDIDTEIGRIRSATETLRDQWT